MKSFYNVGFRYLVDEERKIGKETKIIQKKKSGQILVLASSCTDAETVANTLIGSYEDATVTKVVKTNISQVTNGKENNMEIDE